MISRGTFLATSAMATGLAGIADGRGEPSFHFDSERFDTILNAPSKHKMCFGSTYSGGGTVLDLMTHTLDAYENREGPRSAHVVAVLYHGTSYTMALADTFWHDVLEPYVRKGGAERARLWGDVSHNPFLNDPARGGATVDTLSKRGAHFFLCNNAVSGGADDFARELGESPTIIYQAMVRAIVPSAMLVPAGVMAICAAQEARFAYLQATLS
jgi:intracellular sulfur oxidation DsrE/DsrF family protein